MGTFYCDFGTFQVEFYVSGVLYVTFTFMFYDWSAIKSVLGPRPARRNNAWRF